MDKSSDCVLLAFAHCFRLKRCCSNLCSTAVSVIPLSFYTIQLAIFKATVLTKFEQFSMRTRAEKFCTISSSNSKAAQAKQTSKTERPWWRSPRCLKSKRDDQFLLHPPRSYIAPARSANKSMTEAFVNYYTSPACWMVSSITIVTLFMAQMRQLVELGNRYRAWRLFYDTVAFLEDGVKASEDVIDGRLKTAWVAGQRETFHKTRKHSFCICVVSKEGLTVVNGLPINRQNEIKKRIELFTQKKIFVSQCRHCGKQDVEVTAPIR